MSQPTLHYRAGFAGSHPEQRSAVRSAQQALVRHGFPCEVDGYFGDDMLSQVKAFQAARSLDVDGIVGPAVWEALAGEKASATDESGKLLSGFRGDLEWVHAREGHSGQPYWPGGESGVTLDPGLDLGYADPLLLKRIYGTFLGARQMQELQHYIGLKGRDAHQALLASSQLKAINISWSQAALVFPYTAEPYWAAACQRFSRLPENQTPAVLHTVMLSLVYNRGAHNKALAPLEALLAQQEWLAMADCIAAMQQDHPLPAISQRRRMEAALIREALG